MRISLLLLILLPAVPLFAAAQTTPNSPTEYYSYSDLNSTAQLVFVFAVAAFLVTGFVSVCIHQCYNAAGAGEIPLYAAAASSRSQLSPNGLDPAVINSFPIFNYSEIKHLKIGKGELSCAVCVSEFEDGERLRWLPKCDHVFHPECIDLWLASHSTCPICRANLGQETESTRLTEACRSTAEIQNWNQFAVDVSRVEIQNQNEIAIDERVRVNLPRPHSTGHSLVGLGEDGEMYMLRLPEELRRSGLDRGGTPDRWFFTMTPPFLSRTGSLWLAKVGFVDGRSEQMSSGLPV